MLASQAASLSMTGVAGSSGMDFIGQDLPSIAAEWKKLSVVGFIG